MSVIIRLQNLPWSANALDIRQYFRGLSIPEGGVHIVGGEQGDAFIAFSTDEDARQAMMLDGGKIKEVKIKLFLSSRAEMQKVIEHARQQSMTLQSFMQMPAPPITAASLQTSLMNQIPNTTVPTIPVSSAAPVTTVVPDVHQPGVTIPERRDSREMDRDKKDTDSVNSINKDNKRDRKERSRSRDGDRRDRKDRDRDRHRDRDRDRDRDRRRRDRSRSRERSSRRRDRRDRSRTRERSRSRDHTSRDRERDSKRNSRERKRDSVPPVVEEDKNKDQNGDVIILNTFPPAGKDRVINQPPAVASPSKGNIMQQQQQQQPVVTSASSWDAPSGPGMPTLKSAGIGNRPMMMPMDTSSERQLEARRLLGSTPFSGDSLRPLGMSLVTDTMQSFSRRDPFSTTRDSAISSLSLRGRESWPPGRQASELSRFGRERVGNFPMGQGGFNTEHDDFEREMDPRASYRGGYRGMDFRRGGFPARDTRLGGPGGSLLDRMGPGGLSQNELDDRRIGSTFPPNDRRTPFRMEREVMECFQRMDRFDQFDRNQMNERTMNERSMNERPMNERPMNERQFPPTRPGMQDRFQREKFGTQEQNFEPRVQFPGNCVEIRNMPIEAGYGDIRRFFQGLHITSNGLKLINDNHGNRVGIAYVKFQKREGKDEALNYNGRSLRGSAVEILHLNEEIFENAIDSYKPPEIELDAEPEEIKEVVDPFVCLCIKELPAYAKEPDIIKLFTDIPVSEIFIAQSDDELKQDIAYVKFESHEFAQKALNSNIKYTISQKPVNLAACALDELEDARKRKKVEVQKVEEPKQPPPQQQPQSQPEPQPQPQQQPQQQPQPQPTPVVENKSEPVQNSKSPDPRTRNEAAPIQEQPPQKIVLPQSDCILLRGLPVQANDRDILDFFSDVGLVPLRIHIMLDKFGKPIGDAFCEFNTVEEGARAFTKNGTPLGKQEVSVKPVLRAEMNEALGLIPQTEMPMSQVGMARMQPHGRDFGGRPAGLLGLTPAGPPMGRMPLLGRHPGSLPPGAMHPVGQPLDAFGNPGCVVSFENIPFRADIDEILDFLADFDVSRENVMRRFTDKGLATGDARVAFISPSEAQRAIRELRFRKIRGRQIFLKLLT